MCLNVWKVTPGSRIVARDAVRYGASIGMSLPLPLFVCRPSAAASKYHASETYADHVLNRRMLTLAEARQFIQAAARKE